MDEVLKPMTARQLAKHLGFKSSSTVRRWKCPAIELGSPGRGHKTLYDPIEVQRWLLAQWLPTIRAQADRDVLKIVATALYDVLKRDGLKGQTLSAEFVALKVYERTYLNVTHEPLQANDLPDELKPIVANYLDSVEERGHSQRR